MVHSGKKLCNSLYIQKYGQFLKILIIVQPSKPSSIAYTANDPVYRAPKFKTAKGHIKSRCATDYVSNMFLYCLTRCCVIKKSNSRLNLKLFKQQTAEHIIICLIRVPKTNVRQMQFGRSASSRFRLPSTTMAKTHCQHTQKTVPSSKSELSAIAVPMRKSGRKAGICKLSANRIPSNKLNFKAQNFEKVQLITDEIKKAFGSEMPSVGEALLESEVGADRIYK